MCFCSAACPCCAILRLCTSWRQLCGQLRFQRGGYAKRLLRCLHMSSSRPRLATQGEVTKLSLQQKPLPQVAFFCCRTHCLLLQHVLAKEYANYPDSGVLLPPPEACNASCIEVSSAITICRALVSKHYWPSVGVKSLIAKIPFMG